MVSELYDSHSDRLAIVTYHVNDDGFDVPWGQNRLNSFYGIPGTVPTMKFDGNECPMGFYPDCLDDRLGTTTDVTIDLMAEQINGPSWRILAEICVESGGSSKAMRMVTTVQLDDYPNPPDHSRFTLMQDALSHDISVAAGSCIETESTFNFGPTAWQTPENIKITAWVEEPVNVAPAEIYQAAEMRWPFPQTAMLTSIEVTPAAPSLMVGKSLDFTATGIDQYGQAIGIESPNWSVSGTGSGTIDSSGDPATIRFTAAKEGTVTLICSDGSISGSASFTITKRIPAPRRPGRRFRP